MCVCVCVCARARVWCNAILHSSSDLSQDIKNNPLGFVSISLHCLCTPAQSTVCVPGIHTSGPNRDVGSKTSFSKWFYASSLSFYLFFVCACSVVSDSLQPHGLLPTRLLCPWDCPGKHIGVGCHAILQGSFPTQGLNPHLWSAALAGGFFATVPPGKPPSLTEDPQALDARHSPQHSLSLSCSSWNRYMSLWHLLTLLATWWPQSPGCRDLSHPSYLILIPWLKH